MRRLDTPIFHLEHVVKAKTDQREDFTGPLDLILHLLEKNKIEIRDVSVSFILDQYLDYLNARKQMDLEIASEFVAMASHLVYIKTKMLLTTADEKEPSEMEDLIRSLEQRQQSAAYEALKEAARLLGEGCARGMNCIVRGPEDRKADEQNRLTHRPEDLTRAMERLSAREAGRRPPPVSIFESVVPRESYPVERKTAELLARLIRFGTSRFSALFRGSRCRSEIVATFIALLELCRVRRIRLDDGEGDCMVTVCPREDKKDA